MHKDTFNADFYITAATVIPILYLALTLQGQTFEQMIKRMVKGLPRRKGLTLWQFVLSRLFRSAFVTASSAIIFFAILGEWDAILALYNRSASPTTGSIVLGSLLILMIAVIAGPALRWMWSAVEAGKASRPAKATDKRSEDSRESP
jgi:hypothetical protein